MMIISPRARLISFVGFISCLPRSSSRLNRYSGKKKESLHPSEKFFPEQLF